jgi:hypothetical protein
MLTALSRRLTYANVTATLALFVALGGGAVALEGKNSVNSGDIKQGAVKSSDLKDEGVKAKDLAGSSVGASEVASGAVGSAEVADASLAGEDVAPDALTGDEIDESSLSVFSLPGTSGLASRIRNVGTDGDVLYGGPSGDTLANASMEAVQMVGRAGTTTTLDGMTVHIDTAPGPGESRTISVVRRAVPDSTELPTTLSCTLEEGERFCTDEDVWAISTNLFAIKIETDGTGLPAGDEAYVGLGVAGGSGG